MGIAEVCGGIAVSALAIALEAVRRNRRLSQRLDQHEGCEDGEDSESLLDRFS